MEKDRVTRLLKEHGLRNTEMRKSVLGLFLKSDRALSQQDIDESLPDSDRVTLYRTLRSFEEKGLVHRAVDGSATAKFALCRDICSEVQHLDAHAHFHCAGCGSTYCVDDIAMPPVPTRYKGARIGQVHLILEGMCACCQ